MHGPLNVKLPTDTQNSTALLEGPLPWPVSPLVQIAPRRRLVRSTHWWNDADRGKPKHVVKNKKPVLVPLWSSQTSHGLVQDQTRDYAMRGRRLSTSAKGRPLGALGLSKWYTTKEPKRNPRIFITTANWLMEFREITAVYCENYRTATNTLCGGQNSEFLHVKRRRCI
jgi:hypothetical protein